MIIHEVKIPPYPLEGQSKPDWEEFTKMTSNLYFKKENEIYYHNDVIIYRATRKKNRDFKYFLKKYWEGVLNTDNIDDQFRYIKLK